MITTLILLSIILILNFGLLSIDVLVLSIILLIVAYRFTRRTKLDYLVYSFAAALAVTTIVIDLQMIRSGLFGVALLTVVMLTGVLPDKWSLTKKLKVYRGFYSILGVILILPHAYHNLFMDQQINVFGVAAMIIILPLFLTSFNLIKKEMNMNEWVKLQKASYLVYVLIFLHLISVADWFGKVVYAVMLTLYINNKLVKEFRK